MKNPSELFRDADKVFEELEKLSRGAHTLHQGRMSRAEETSSAMIGTRKFQFSATRNNERITYTLIRETGFPKREPWWKFWRIW